MFGLFMLEISFTGFFNIDKRSLRVATVAVAVKAISGTVGKSTERPFKYPNSGLVLYMQMFKSSTCNTHEDMRTYVLYVHIT